jgi:hypothetical protein
MYTKIASIKQQEGNLQYAENIYHIEKHPHFRKMIDLVTKIFPDQVEKTHAYLGNQLKSSGDWKQALQVDDYASQLGFNSNAIAALSKLNCLSNKEGGQQTMSIALLLKVSKPGS